MASSDSDSPLISTFTPVNTLSSSSRPAATNTWPTAFSKSAASTSPVWLGMSGSVGYSSTGSVWRVKRAWPQVSSTFE